MAEYILSIKPLAPFRTPLQSDTLFGHICWALRYIKGEDILLAFLNSFDGNSAPLLLSSGFPSGYLPMPVLRTITVDEEETLWDRHAKGNMSRLDFYRKMKRLGKAIYCEQHLIQALQDGLSYFAIYEQYFSGKALQNDICFADGGTWRQTTETWHNSKNRLTDRVGGGNLFALEDTCFADNTTFTVFLRDDSFGEQMLRDLLDYIAFEGYGADKTVGRGAFSFELANGWQLGTAGNTNGFISLSHFHPAPGQNMDGYYEVSTKFGKIGGHWASSGKGGPHKQPLLMFNPGSFFYDDNLRNFYGALVPNVHHEHRSVVHYGLTVPLPVRCV